jgi:hypothetical protein
MFPSEKEVPPKHVSRSEKAEGHSRSSKFVASSVESVAISSETPVLPAPPAPVASAPAIEQPAPSPAASSFWSSKPAAQPEPPKIDPPKAEEPSFFKSSTPAPEAPSAPKPWEVAAKTEEPIAPLEIEPVSTPVATRGSHWLDAVTPSAKAPVDAELEESRAMINAQEAIAPVPAPEATQVPPPPVAASSQPATSEQSKADPFFADDLDSAASSLSQAAKPNAADGFSHAAEQLEEPGQLSKDVSQGADPNWLAEPEPADPMSQDPDLVVPPAVKVTPEPLLVDDEAPKGPSGYGQPKQERLEQPFEFAPPPSCNGEPAQLDAEAEAAQSDRVPTGPPPNREVLAEIPFLSPPPEVLAAAAKENNIQPTQPPDVDEMVRKVLEKLGPQLQDLLSQGMLKPLVEDVLQNEIKKK